MAAGFIQNAVQGLGNIFRPKDPAQTTDTPAPYPEQGVIDNPQAVDTGGETPKLDVTKQPWRSAPPSGMPPEQEWHSTWSEGFRYGPDATVEQATQQIMKLKEMGMLAPKYASLPAPLRPQLVASAQMSIDAQNGLISAGDLEANFKQLSENPPVPERMSPQEREQYLNRIYPEIAERPKYDPAKLGAQAIFALLAGRGNAGAVLQNEIGTTQAQMGQDYQRTLQNQEQQANRALAEMKMVQSDYDQTNAFNADQWKAKIGAAKDAQGRKDFYETRFYNANTLGEKLQAAKQMGLKIAFDDQNNLKQDGTDPAVWEDVQAFRRKQAQDEHKAALADEVEARRVAALKAQTDNQQADNFNQYLNQISTQHGGLTAEQASVLEDQRQQLLDSGVPEFMVAPIVEGQNYRAKHDAQLAAEFQQTFSQRAAQFQASWVQRQAQVEIANERLNRAIETARHTGVNSGVGPAATAKITATRAAKMDTERVKAADAGSRIGDIQASVTAIEKERNSLSAQLKSAPPFSDQAATLTDQIKRTTTSLEKARQDLTKAKANKSAADARLKEMKALWGDGSQNLPAYPDVQRIEDYASPEIDKAMAAARSGKPPVPPVVKSGYKLPSGWK